MPSIAERVADLETHVDQSKAILLDVQSQLGRHDLNGNSTGLIGMCERMSSQIATLQSEPRGEGIRINLDKATAVKLISVVIAAMAAGGGVAQLLGGVK